MITLDRLFGVAIKKVPSFQRLSKKVVYAILIMIWIVAGSSSVPFFGWREYKEAEYLDHYWITCNDGKVYQIQTVVT